MHPNSSASAQPCRENANRYWLRAGWPSGSVVGLVVEDLLDRRDGLDEHAYHVLAFASDGTPIGTGRLLQDAHIGRMAVLKEWRRRGVGSAMLDVLLVAANKMGYGEVKLNAQTRALNFYLRKGFTSQGEEFMDAGIPHISMVRTTADQTSWPAAFVTRAVAPMSS